VLGVLTVVAGVVCFVRPGVRCHRHRLVSSAIGGMAVVLISLIGALFFVLVRSGRLPKRRRDKQRFITEAIAARTEAVPQGQPPGRIAAAPACLGVPAEPQKAETRRVDKLPAEAEENTTSELETLAVIGAATALGALTGVACVLTATCAHG
jgi:hypothetical protein